MNRQIQFSDPVPRGEMSTRLAALESIVRSQANTIHDLNNTNARILATIEEMNTRITDLEGCAEHSPEGSCGVCRPEDGEEPA